MLGAKEIRQLAGTLEIKPTKKLGQNFVIDPNTINRIVSAAGLVPSDIVVEIGPGLGSLTLGLLEKAKSVIAVEIDPKLAKQLPLTIAQHAPGKTVELVLADALQTPRTAASSNGVGREPSLQHFRPGSASFSGHVPEPGKRFGDGSGRGCSSVSSYSRNEGLRIPKPQDVMVWAGKAGGKYR